MIQNDPQSTARYLREQGWKYSDIAESTGLSVDWCKRNLKGIKKGLNDPAVNALVEAATRPQGCTHYEAVGIVYKHYGEEGVTHEKIRALKRAALKANPECLFRPSWMSPTEPVHCTKDLMLAVSDLSDRLTEASLELAQKYPDASFSAIQKELVVMLTGTSPEGILARCERIQEVATALSLRTKD